MINYIYALDLIMRVHSKGVQGIVTRSHKTCSVKSKQTNSKIDYWFLMPMLISLVIFGTLIASKIRIGGILLGRVCMERVVLRRRNMKHDRICPDKKENDALL